VAGGAVRVLGPARHARAFPTWFDTHLIADGLRRAEARRRREASLAS
jgi:hypothetical protein